MKYNIETCSKDTLINFSQELPILLRINHPSFLKFVGYSPISFKSKPKPTMIFENPSNGKLKDFLQDEKNISFFDKTKELIILYGIASGMAYLHSHDIIHCNLSPDCIFLDDFFYPKISGFEYAHDLAKQSKIKESSLKEQTYYNAPEVISKLEYSKSSDVYSFSLIFFRFQNQLYSNTLDLYMKKKMQLKEII